MQNSQIIHAFERHPIGEHEKARHAKAWSSWQKIYDVGVISSPYENYTRSAREIGDNRELPYIKDVLLKALALADSDDSIIAWTNLDIIVHPDLPDALRQFCSVFEVCSAIRCEFKDRAHPLLQLAPDELEKICSPHIGRDLIAATKRWWLKHLPKLGDVILGASHFDIYLASYIRYQRGFKSTRQNIGDIIPCCELPKGYISHEYHIPVWEGLSDATTPSQAHNLEIFRHWAQSKNLNFPPYSSKTIPTVTPKPLPMSTQKRPIINVRRTGALGDVLAATCVATKLHEMGYDVVFSAHPSAHCILRRLDPPLYAIADSSGGAVEVNLDGAYENDPRRREKHFAEMFIERANRHLASLNYPPIENTKNIAPRMRLTDDDREMALKTLGKFPKPWVFICPRSNSFVNRTVPDYIWEEAARDIQGTKFWIGTYKAPNGIVDFGIRHFDLVIAYLGVADLLVTTDTGPSHVAIALGTPTVVVEQQSDPDRHFSDQRDFIKIRPALDCLNCDLEKCPIDAAKPPCQMISPKVISEGVNARLRSATTEDVSAVISIYRPTAERLNRCLNCVLPQVQEVVICYDGAGIVPDGAMQHPKIKYVKARGNDLGYGKKANCGVRHSNGKHVLLLNDDVFLMADAVKHLLDTMNSDPKIAIVGHLLRYVDGTVQHASKFRPMTGVGYGHLDHRMADGRIKVSTEVEDVTGASILFRRKAFYEIGGHWEEYFLYDEDSDACLSVRQKGWKVFYTPLAEGVHEEHASTGMSSGLQKYLDESKKIFTRRWKWYFDKNAGYTGLGRFM